MVDPLLYAVPVFAIAMAVERLALRRSAAPYTTRAVASALGCVALDQLVNASTLVLFAMAYEALHRSASVSRVDGAAGWLLAVLLHDAAYYAFHRLSHRVMVLWAAHVVHHQSETYDFTVSLRQGTVATWITFLFYLPVALVIPAHIFVGVHAGYQIYQFFVHTRFVRSLGPLEWVLATPSHHRVHHGRDREYVDKNYGGIFILFDRALGTFTREKHQPSYGVPGGYDIVSPLFANTYLFARLVDASKKTRGLRELARLWLGPPEKNAALLGSAGHAPRPTNGTARALVPFVLGCAGAVVLTFARAHVPAAAAMLIGLGSVVLLELGSAAFDGRG
jgi:sterol desaturase/sphingolipid hydroxylase (fatty acid hydroxylase superfamily)